MAEVLNLTKGENISLDKTADQLTNIFVGLGWNPQKGAGADFDLDATVLCLTKEGKARNAADMCYFGKLSLYDGVIKHSPDDLTGGSSDDGDDEIITFDLTKMPADVAEAIVAVTIYQAKQRGQTFGQVDNAYIRVGTADVKGNFELENVKVLAKFDLTENASGASAVIMAKLYKTDEGEWKFKVIEEVLKDFEISHLADRYGVMHK
jgi:tellurium resistance protein TerD